MNLQIAILSFHFAAGRSIISFFIQLLPIAQCSPSTVSLSFFLLFLLFSPHLFRYLLFDHLIKIDSEYQMAIEIEIQGDERF